MQRKRIFFISLPLIISAASSILLNYMITAPSPYWWISLIFFLTVFVVINICINLRTDSMSGADIMLSTLMIKLILVIGAIFTYWALDKKGLFAFSIHFIMHYILFTIFEIRYLQAKIKHEDNEK